MRCPKCDEGKILPVFIRTIKRRGFLCELCGAVWFENEDITGHSGHSVKACAGDNDMEYTLDMAGEEQEKRPVSYPVFK